MGQPGRGTCRRLHNETKELDNAFAELEMMHNSFQTTKGKMVKAADLDHVNDPLMQDLVSSYKNRDLSGRGKTAVEVDQDDSRTGTSCPVYILEEFDSMTLERQWSTGTVFLQPLVSVLTLHV